VAEVGREGGTGGFESVVEDFGGVKVVGFVFVV